MNPKGTPKNLKPFKKGQSGNPGGRPRKLYTEAHTKVAVMKAKDIKISPDDTVPMAAAKRAAQRAIEGSVRHLESITDRVEGKALQGVRIEGQDGCPVQFEAAGIEEVRQRIADLQERIRRRRK